MYWYLFSKLVAWRKALVNYNGTWILGRYACLGREVLYILKISYPDLNIQKGRIDYLIDCVNDPSVKVKTWRVARHMERKDIISLLWQEENLKWFRMHPPTILYMDSFAELTDQLFVHRKEGWRFCCNYSDLKHDSGFQEKFDTVGLLSVDDLIVQYRRYFGFIRERFGNIPVVFIHYPLKLEDREKFRVRYQHILEAITIISNEFQPFYSVTIDEAVVDWPEERKPETYNFPYHYNRPTYKAVVERIREIGILDKLKADN